jgi:hypothetical protein
LSVLGGALSIVWSRTGGGLDILWRERNVPGVQKPVRVGFGAQLLTRALPRQTGTTVNISDEPDGVEARLILALAGEDLN